MPSKARRDTFTTSLPEFSGKHAKNYFFFQFSAAGEEFPRGWRFKDSNNGTIQKAIVYPWGKSLIFFGIPLPASPGNSILQASKMSVFLGPFSAQDTLLLRTACHSRARTSRHWLSTGAGRPKPPPTSRRYSGVPCSEFRVAPGTATRLFLPARPAGLLYTFAHPQNPANGPPNDHGLSLDKL